jgi:signal transduction histidine kinase
MMNLGLKRSYVSGKLKLFIIPLFIFIPFALVSFTPARGNGGETILLLSSTFFVSRVFLNLLFTISGALLVICQYGFFESELRLRHKDGHYINLSARSVAVRDDKGEFLGALTISRDITKLKQIHEDLVKANEEAEASNRLKSSFLANISHEIRTPLNSVVGFSNLLLSNNLTKEVKEEYIEHINHNSEKLLQIIGDIIDLSRLESSQIEITYEEASVDEIVDEVIDEATSLRKAPTLFSQTGSGSSVS